MVTGIYSQVPSHVEMFDGTRVMFDIQRSSLKHILMVSCGDYPITDHGIALPSKVEQILSMFLSQDVHRFPSLTQRHWWQRSN